MRGSHWHDIKRESPRAPSTASSVRGWQVTTRQCAWLNVRHHARHELRSCAFRENIDIEEDDGRETMRHMQSRRFEHLGYRRSSSPLRVNRRWLHRYTDVYSTKPTRKASIFSIFYNDFPPMNSLHRRTSDGMPSFFGNFLLMHSAKRTAVWENVLVWRSCGIGQMNDVPWAP
jgi:hypothetical protein